MKKVLIFLLLFSCIFVMASCGKKESSVVEDTPSADAPSGQTVNAEKSLAAILTGAEIVNIRLEPTTDSRIIDTVRRGELFRVLETEIQEAPGKSWAKIIIKGSSAYISESFISYIDYSDEDTILLGRIVNTDTFVNIRTDDSMDAAVLYQAKKGEQVLIVEKNASQGWHKVFYPETDAYVAAEYVSLEEAQIIDTFQ